MKWKGISYSIRRWALANALEHGGKASPKAVIGKLMAERPDLKAKISEITRIVAKEVERVNRLSSEQQRVELERLGPPKRVEHRERRGLPELPDVDRFPKVVTRFAPNPNGPLHLGHVRTALLSYEYSRKYNGKFILRFEDTNPANALDEMYDLIREDLRWLGIEWDEEYLQSGRLEIYYRYAEKLLGAGDAYVCTCNVGKFREMRDRGRACPCRNLSPDEHLRRWKGMLEGRFDEGEAVVRIKTDLGHPNPALRDWPIFRIVTTPHPKVGRRYRVWPLYNFSVSVDDHELGVTHVIRGKEHEVNEMRQRQLFERLGWDYPVAIQHGRLSISGTVLSKTKTMDGIREGRYEGYDDPRLGTIVALRRRGFSPEAVRRVILDIGLTPVNSRLSMDTLCAENRRIIDPRANRYFFVPDPQRLSIKGVPRMSEVRLRLHPSHPERGDRIIPLQREDTGLVVWIASGDASTMRSGEIVRLKDFLNFKLISREPLEGKFAGFEVLNVPKVQWVSAGAVECEVLKPDGSRDQGLVEPGILKLCPGEVVQFERYGFVRIEKLKPSIMAVFAHR